MASWQNPTMAIFGHKTASKTEGNSIPSGAPEIHPGRFTFFFRKENPFSNWFLRDITDGEVTYNCNEQRMMAQKALLFGDHDTYREIMKARSQGAQKKLGRDVKPFVEKVWIENRRPIVAETNILKFSQHHDLAVLLLETEGTRLVEASKYDKIWGIGLDESHPDARHPERWPGENILGDVLTYDVRPVIRKMFDAGEIPAPTGYRP